MNITPFLNHLRDVVAHVPVSTLYYMVIGAFTLTALLFLILALVKTQKKQTPQPLIDFEAISGDDVLTTQLDLARAYIEMDKKQSAEKILKNVMKRGNTAQKNEAKQLIAEAI